MSGSGYAEWIVKNKFCGSITAIGVWAWQKQHVETQVKMLIFFLFWFMHKTMCDNISFKFNYVDHYYLPLIL